MTPAVPTALSKPVDDMSQLPGMGTVHKLVACLRDMDPDDDPRIHIPEKLMGKLMQQHKRNDFNSLDAVRNAVYEIGVSDGAALARPKLSQEQVEAQARALFGQLYRRRVGEPSATEAEAKREEEKDLLPNLLLESHRQGLLRSWAFEALTKLHPETTAGPWKEQRYALAQGNARLTWIGATPPLGYDSGPALMAKKEEETKKLTPPEAFNPEGTSEEIGNTCLALANLHHISNCLQARMKYDSIKTAENSGATPEKLDETMKFFIGLQANEGRRALAQGHASDPGISERHIARYQAARLENFQTERSAYLRVAHSGRAAEIAARGISSTPPTQQTATPPAPTQSAPATPVQSRKARGRTR